ncbi:PilZ domain-containing protein [Pseudoduganella chitinolytica]|uniref:PilZ domain-containing protein n=1 Tax=Pseudoduganella chitinolytica TaxID=34070 RepID=A0ABY8BET4_9BURK|nr:PilZ domain-containing protein [Pseudoduganella chitinolytica]WEF33486.1 PilZ domain-containing protein [Pseudoduganella chitinolytica]
MDNEKRLARRRILRVRAMVEIGSRPVAGRTHDISSIGIAILLPMATAVGCQARVHFMLPMGGRMHAVVVAGRVTNCTLSADEFRTGFAFVAVGAEQQALIDRFCSES